MILTGAFFNSGCRTEQNNLAYLTHLLEEFFKPPVIGDGFFEEGSLSLRQGGGESLSLYFSSEAPSVRRFVHQATLSNLWSDVGVGGGLSMELGSESACLEAFI
jgi:hypothetical protein